MNTPSGINQPQEPSEIPEEILSAIFRLITGEGLPSINMHIIDEFFEENGLIDNNGILDETPFLKGLKDKGEIVIKEIIDERLLGDKLIRVSERISSKDFGEYDGDTFYVSISEINRWKTLKPEDLNLSDEVIALKIIDENLRHRPKKVT